MNSTLDLSAVKDRINKANETYSHRTFGDPDFFAATYTKDAWVMPKENPKIVGRENILKYFKADSNDSHISVKVVAEEIFGNAEQVYETGTYELIANGNTSIEQGKFIVIWKQENGTWKIYREIWNTNSRGEKQ